MKLCQYPSNLILGSIVIHTPYMAFARRVEEIAKVELAESGLTSGVANVDGFHIPWSALSSLKRCQP